MGQGHDICMYNQPDMFTEPHFQQVFIAYLIGHCIIVISDTYNNGEGGSPKIEEWYYLYICAYCKNPEFSTMDASFLHSIYMFFQQLFMTASMIWCHQRITHCLPRMRKNARAQRIAYLKGGNNKKFAWASVYCEAHMLLIVRAHTCAAYFTSSARARPTVPCNIISECANFENEWCITNTILNAGSRPWRQ